MLTNNNLHTVRLVIKTKTEVKQAVRKKINKKRYLYPLTVSMVFTLFGLHVKVAMVNYAFYTHLTKYYSNSAEHTFLLITINAQASTDTDKGRNTV